MPELHAILEQIEADKRPAVEQLLTYLKREQGIASLSQLAVVKAESVDSALRTIAERSPFLELEPQVRGTLVQQIQQAAKRLAQLERERVDQRRKRPAVPLNDLSRVLVVSRELQDAWKTAGISSARDLLSSKAAKVITDKNIPLPKRRELLAVTKLAIASHNLKLSEALHKDGITSLSRLARTPRKRLEKLIASANLTRDDLDDALELQQRSRLARRQSQNFAATSGSARYNFGPPPANFDFQPDLGQLPNFGDLFDLRIDPVDETTSCATCSECENTFSPLAYLFDLIDFINDEWEVTVQDLEAILLQNIQALNCDLANEATTQIRIAIGVLEKFIGGQILRTNNDWKVSFNATANALVRLLSDVLALAPPINSVAALASDARFAGNAQVQALITALSSNSPAIAEVDVAENALRTVVEAHIDSQYPLPAEPINPNEGETLEFLIERSRQEQSRAVERQKFEKLLAQIIEATHVDYRTRLIEKTQKSILELENSLFIHLTGAPCHRTTPITQLILSLQAFILAVRTSEIVQLQKTPRLSPRIGNNDFSIFDEETWSWLETYAKWSSAMYAFLYPENVMGLPTLRNPLSPLFADTMQRIDVSSSAGAIDSAYEDFTESLRNLRLLQLISAHVADEKLYVFASYKSLGIWMNTVDLKTLRTSGWKEMFEGNDQLLPWAVAPHYGSDGLRFIAGFYHRGTDDNGWPFFDSIRLKWLTLDGHTESGPDVRVPSDSSHLTGGLSLGIERQNSQLVTYLKWISSDGSSSGNYTEVKDLLGSDGSWTSMQLMPTNDIFGSLEEFVGDRRFRLGGFRYDSVTVTALPANQAHVFDVEPLHVPPGNPGSPKYRIASNPDSLQTYLVIMPASSYQGVSAYSPLDLESMSLANDWHALSATLELVETEFAELEAGSGVLSPALNNLYVEERYLHFPLLAAWSLNRSGDYPNAHDWLLRLYNPFSAERSEVFPFSRFFTGAFERPEEWLGDPLNPHVIGRQRAGTYLRHAILFMVKNLLDWADHEFTLNNVESRHRAEELYRLARQVLGAPDLGNQCQEGLMTLEFEVGRRYRMRATDLFSGLEDLPKHSAGKQTILDLLTIVKSDEPLNNKRQKGQKRIDAGKRNGSRRNFADLLDVRNRYQESVETRLLSKSPSWLKPQPEKGDRYAGTWLAALATGRTTQSLQLEISRDAGGEYRGTLQRKQLDSISINPATNSIEFRQKSRNLVFKGSWQNGLINGEATSNDARIKKQMIFRQPTFDSDLMRPDLYDWPGFELEPVTVSLCVPPNPLLAAFDSHITIALLGLDQCRMISGEFQPATHFPVGALQDSTVSIVNLLGGSTSTTIASDQPRYRFGYLYEQARQRAALAKQLGDALVGALRERDQASYDRLLAENAREFAGATRELKELVRIESRDAKLIAETQLSRAESNQSFWNDRISSNPGGLSKAERDALGLLAASGGLQFAAAMVNFAMALPSAIVAGVGTALSTASAGVTLASAGSTAPITVPSWAVGAMGIAAGVITGGEHIAGGLQGLGGALGTWANEQLTRASFARRWEEWNLQNVLANFDQQIAQLQNTLAEDRLNISDKDLEIAGLQYLHAQRVYEFLQNKTLNKELYEWMVSVLIEQYRAVMQSATSVAQLAQRALEFESQSPVTLIKGDYWTIDAPSLREDQKGYGLLGAERLLTDLTRLDDFRLSTDKRRLQLAKTISLAQRLPADFVRFRQTGKIEFDTLLDWFDEDFPGHYLRLIKTVRVSVLALVPPIDGIHATLNNVGASTVTFPDRAPQRSLRTFGESIALDSPYNESGLFLLDYNDPMLLPFEGLGVETHWQLWLPRPNNRFNFDTIADLLFTIEYTALSDEGYGERVKQRLGTRRASNSVLSLRSNFPDQWYHLQNPLDATIAQVSSLNIPRNVYAPGVQNLVLKHLTILLVPAEPATAAVLRAQLPANGISIKVGGISLGVGGNSIDLSNGSVTTMQPGSPGGAPFTDPTFDGQNVVPFGTWEITIAPELYVEDSNGSRKLDLLADILLVPTVEGDIIY